MKHKRLFKLQDGKCFYCKCEMVPLFPGQVKLQDDSVTRDHIIPKSRIKTPIEHNTVLACYKCNHKRSNMEFIEFVSISGHFNNE